MSQQQQQGQPIRILIVDDHAVLRAGLQAVIEARPGMRVVGEAGDREAALACAAAAQPDIILLDLDLGEESGADLLPELLDVAPDAHIIVLTGVRDPLVHRRVVMQGAMGLVLKEKAIGTVLKAIEKVHAGEVWLDRTMIANVLNTRARAKEDQEDQAEAVKIASLTEREREIIGLVGEGMKNRQIAERLVISEATVRNHMTSIFSKLDVTDRFELAVYAYRHGLASVPK